MRRRDEFSDDLIRQSCCNAVRVHAPGKYIQKQLGIIDDLEGWGQSSSLSLHHACATRAASLVVLMFVDVNVFNLDGAKIWNTTVI